MERDAEGVNGEMSGRGVYPLYSRLGGLGHRKLPQPLMIFGHYIPGYTNLCDFMHVLEHSEI